MFMVFEKSFLRDFFIAEIAQDLKKKKIRKCALIGAILIK